MNLVSAKRLTLAAAVALGFVAHEAAAVTQAVTFNSLNTTASLLNPLQAGDNLRLDTLVTSGPGPLSQTITFILGSSVGALTGAASWEVNTATGTGPRLIGVNIDIFDASNTLVVSDTFEGVLATFAHSSFLSAIGPGTYRMVATGTGVRDSSLDVSLSFLQPVPEPQTYLLLAAGLGMLGLAARRRRRSD